MTPFAVLSRKARCWLARSPQERSLFLQAYGMLLLISLALQWRGLRWTQSRLMQFLPPVEEEQPNLKSLLPLLRSVHLAVKYSPWSNCLRQSLVLWYFLRRQGLNGQLWIGTRSQQGKIQAHAWVEYQETVLNDLPGVRQLYSVFPQPIEFKESTESSTSPAKLGSDQQG